MSVREEMINAKIEGNLHKYTTEKLGSLINNFNDFSEFIDIVEEMNKEAARPARPNHSPDVIKVLRDFVRGQKRREGMSEKIFKARMKKLMGTGTSSGVTPKKALILSALAGVGGIGTGLAWAGRKRAHSNILDQLKKDPSYQDKAKVENIYKMISQFAPKASSNPTFAKSVMDQLYNSPAVTAPMVKEIVQVEKDLQGSAGIKNLTQSISNIKGIVP